MNVRLYGDTDLDTIRTMHEAMQIGYTFSGFSPLFAVKRVVEDARGRVIAAGALKLTSEAFLWLDEIESSVKKLHAIAALNTACTEDARKMGLEDCTCWVPPRIARTFKAALQSLGWEESAWPSFTYKL